MDTTTLCWRCGRTLQQHPPGARWHAGHTIDGSNNWEPWYGPDLPPPGDWLTPEASTCNTSAGATYGNRNREPHSEQW